MKKIIYALLTTLTGLVLLFSYRTSLDAIPPTATEPAVSGSTTTGTTASGGNTGGDANLNGSASSPPSPSPTAASSLADGTYTGDSTGTRYGPVQVQVTVAGGQISDVQVVDYPDGNGRDRQINQNAIPQLVSETVRAQSAQIDMVSGATYTSRGYVTSLQSALDQAQS